MDCRRRMEQFLVFAGVAAALYLLEEERGRKRSGRPSARRRNRRTVEEVYDCLGSSYFRRAYRMSYQSFWTLHSKVGREIQNATERHGRTPSGSFNLSTAPPPPVPNGTISTSVRLAVAIRYFAGGSPYDLCGLFGISHSSVHDSVWIVVEAINNLQEFHISYPESHEEQRKIASGFKAKSQAGFDVCAGAIDGILIWTQKPSKPDCTRLQLGARKFFCGRKHKYGLNCQAVCDARGRFLDISICLGGASADCMAFERSGLYKKLEEGILADDVCLFGDNAYLNTNYMATPYINSGRLSSGSRDNYNFYHSQLRIGIECAFGMWTERWAILRSAMPKNQRIHKTISLVNALAKLHNFCIDIQEGSAGDLHAKDYASLISNPNGYVPLVPTAEAVSPLPLQLLHGGEHLEEIPREVRRSQNDAHLPRQRLCEMVQQQHLVRPRASFHARVSL
jgi:hypothetical protein